MLRGSKPWRPGCAENGAGRADAAQMGKGGEGREAPCAGMDKVVAEQVELSRLRASRGRLRKERESLKNVGVVGIAPHGRHPRPVLPGRMAKHITIAGGLVNPANGNPVRPGGDLRILLRCAVARLT